MASLVEGISFAIRSIKRDKGDGGVISARSAKRLSAQQRERHTIDSTNLVRTLMRWFKWRIPPQKTTQLSGNLHDIGDNFLVVFYVFGNSGPSREVYVDFGSVIEIFPLLKPPLILSVSALYLKRYHIYLF